jgi:transglutaminase-like putative cysteine protease
MLLRIDHETKLTYSEPVSEHVFEVRMAPLSDEDQTALGYRLRMVPAASATPFRDGFGNRVDLFNLLTPCQEVLVRTMSFVRTHRRPGPVRLEKVPWPGEQPVGLEALEFLQPSPLVGRGPEVDAFVASCALARRKAARREGEAPVELDEEGSAGASPSLAAVVLRLIACVAGRLTYEKKVTSARTPVAEALALGRGVCQDFAHLYLAACRGLGLPARYVSGYVHQPGELATHAWCQVWGGGAVGWVDVDPTHGRFADDDYVVTAVGRDYSDVPPNRGAWKGLAEESISVTVTVEEVNRLPGDWIELESAPPRAISPSNPTARSSRTTGLSHQTRTPPTLRHQKSQQQ